MRIGNIDKVINQSYAQIRVNRTYVAQASINFRFIRNACFKNILNHTKIEVCRLKSVTSTIIVIERKNNL